MNTTNPVLGLIESRKNNTVLDNIKYPIKVYCIVDDLSDASRDPLLRDIKNHAINSGVIFTTREYDSQKFSNDRDIIQRLPAFHVYINKGYNRTFYPNTRPLDHINECIRIYLNNEDIKIKRRERWSKMYQWFKNLIRKFKWRETAMERYERHRISDNSNRKIDIYDFKKNIVPVSEWN